MAPKKWTRIEVEALIQAYQDHPSLYAIGSANYHNKHIRALALSQIAAKLQKLRPDVTEKECAEKFHSLRSQFNIEERKVRTSVKSGQGRGDIYLPTLWYHNKLLFLKEYFVPRKGRSSIQEEENCVKNGSRAELLSDCLQINLQDKSPDEEIFSIENKNKIGDEVIQVYGDPDMEDPLLVNSNEERILHIEDVVPANEEKKRCEDHGLMEKLIASLNTPVTVVQKSPDGIASFVSSIESLLRDIEKPEVRLEVMNRVWQICYKGVKHDKDPSEPFP